MEAMPLFESDIKITVKQDLARIEITHHYVNFNETYINCALILPQNKEFIISYIHFDSKSSGLISKNATSLTGFEDVITIEVGEMAPASTGILKLVFNT